MERKHALHVQIVTYCYMLSSVLIMSAAVIMKFQLIELNPWVRYVLV